MVELVVSLADKQKQGFYPGSGPSGGGKNPTSCLSGIDRARLCGYKEAPARCRSR